MKKFIYTVLTCILAFSCSLKENSREEIVTDKIPISKLNFDISVGDADPVKSAKTGWTSGDKIDIWFDNHYAEATPDLILLYDGSKWSRTFEREGCVVSASGTFAALFESGNNLDAFNRTTGSQTTTYGIPAAGIDGFNFGCTPMVISSTGVSYSVNSSTRVLKAVISGWQYATRFKVLIPTDPSMNKPAGRYALSVSKVCHPLKSFGTKKNAGADRVDLGIVSDILSRYSGGVQEADGIAFYFDSMSCSDEKVTFALLESGSKTAKTYTTSEKKTLNATSGSCCTGLSIQYSAFGSDSFHSGDGEIPEIEDMEKFQIVYELSDLEDSVTLALSQKIATRIGEAKGKILPVVESSKSTAHTREIIVGRTNRPQSKEFYSENKDDFVWRIKYAEGNVVITAGGSWALEYAVDRFLEEYLNPGFVYVEGKVVNGTVRGKQLFPLTPGCNLRILDQNVWVREDDVNTGYWADRGESCAISVRKRRLCQVVRSCMPDIIAFQEFGNGLNTAVKDSLTAYGYDVSKRTSNYYTPIFFNKNTISYVYKWHLKFPEFTASDGSKRTPDAMKSYTAILFEHKATKKKFLVVNTHIYTSLATKYDYECKTSEIRTIMDKINDILESRGSDIPVILTGDMNCQRAYEPMQLLEKSGYRHFVDIATLSADGSNGWHICEANRFMREYDPSMQGHYMGWTHDRNQGATKCVDQMYLYNGKDVEVKVFERMHAWFTVLLSDHYPNYADIVL